MLDNFSVNNGNNLLGLDDETIANTRNQISSDVMKFTDSIESVKIRYGKIIDLINNGEWLDNLPSDIDGKVVLKKYGENSLYDKLKKEVNNFHTEEYLLIDEVYKKSLIKLLEQFEIFDDLGVKTSSACVGYRGTSYFTYSIEN